MGIIEQAVEALRQAETTLQRLVSEAAAAGEYETVVEITEWAKVVRGLGGSSSARNGAGRGSIRGSVSSVRRAKTARGDYPRFYRQGDLVVRVGRSKGESSEYHHKAPYGVLLALVDAMVQVGADGRIFSTDDFLPIELDGATVPAYQAYLGIALFKHLGLIDQHGRQGYSIPRLMKFRDAVIGAWKQLPRE